MCLFMCDGVYSSNQVKSSEMMLEGKRTNDA